jgi:hypothetical protein
MDARGPVRRLSWTCEPPETANLFYLRHLLTNKTNTYQWIWRLWRICHTARKKDFGANFTIDVYAGSFIKNPS